MTKLNIIKLDAGHAFGLDGRAMASANMPVEGVMMLDQYEMSAAVLADYNVLVITDFIDQEFLYEQRELIHSFLQDGKIILSCTHIFKDWLPGVNPFMPQFIYKYADYEMEVAAERTVFEGVDLLELAYRKGVSGFYARGYHPLTNPQAEVWLTFKDQKPITYVDRTTTNGTIVVHAGRDLLTYATGENTTKRIATQTMQWLVEELERLEKGTQA